MNEILKPGESGWFRRRDGAIVFAVRVPFKEVDRCIVACLWNGINNALFPNGMLNKDMSEAYRDLVEHLPDCTGFDWSPEAKYVPWDIHTMPDRVLVRRKPKGNTFVARPASHQAVFVGVFAIAYASLFSDYEQLDGGVCGIQSRD